MIFYGILGSSWVPCFSSSFQLWEEIDYLNYGTCSHKGGCSKGSMWSRSAQLCISVPVASTIHQKRERKRVDVRFLPFDDEKNHCTVILGASWFQEAHMASADYAWICLPRAKKALSYDLMWPGVSQSGSVDSSAFSVQRHKMYYLCWKRDAALASNASLILQSGI